MSSESNFEESAEALRENLQELAGYSMRFSELRRNLPADSPESAMLLELQNSAAFIAETIYSIVERMEDALAILKRRREAAIAATAELMIREAEALTSQATQDQSDNNQTEQGSDD